jgi:hypothetical protein
MHLNESAVAVEAGEVANTDEKDVVCMVEKSGCPARQEMSSSAATAPTFLYYYNINIRIKMSDKHCRQAYVYVDDEEQV